MEFQKSGLTFLGYNKNNSPRGDWRTYSNNKWRSIYISHGIWKMAELLYLLLIVLHIGDQWEFLNWEYYNKLWINIFKLDDKKIKFAEFKKVSEIILTIVKIKNKSDRHKMRHGRLLILERKTNLKFTFKNRAIHDCCHDSHMAILLAIG